MIEQKDKFRKQIELRETDRPLSYNFVQMDDGIWVKLYYNAEKNLAPPAFFVIKGMPLYDSYAQDIRELITHAKVIAL